MDVGPERNRASESAKGIGRGSECPRAGWKARRNRERAQRHERAREARASGDGGERCARINNINARALRLGRPNERIRTARDSGALRVSLTSARQTRVRMRYESC